MQVQHLKGIITRFPFSNNNKTKINSSLGIIRLISGDTLKNEFREEEHRVAIIPYKSSPQKVISKCVLEKYNIIAPPYAATGTVPQYQSIKPLIHDEISISKMRKAGKLARRMLNVACSLAEEGITTDEINDIVHDAIIEESCYPSPLNYSGFPKSLCTSVNEVICHGIPDSRPLQKYDVVSFDVSCYINGVHGDNCATVIVGDKNTCTNNNAFYLSQKRLVTCAQEALSEAIKVCRPGANISDIGNAVQNVVDFYGYDTVRKYSGHGIGSEFHIPPWIKHFQNEDELKLEPGMIFTIEPMITEFSSQCVEWDDNWTVVTCDDGRAAQFEHM